MTVELSTLSNGFRIVSHNMPHLETVSLGVWVHAGTRHETSAENGISHLLEHMAFKGTATRSAQAIAEEMDSVGGDLNAATGLEHTSYFARVLKGDVALALDVIADILLNSTFAADELEREREVVLQEIAATKDSPDDLVYELVQEAAFSGQAVGRPILGTPESVRGFGAAQLKAFLGAHYSPDCMVLAAAGAINHEMLHRHAEALFGGLARRSVRGDERTRYLGGVRASTRQFEQSHIVIGFEGPSYRQDDFFTVQVFSGLFGGGLSSRLFQEVREKRGLCYAIYSSAWALEDAGMLSIHAATGPDLMGKLIDVIGTELKRCADAPPTAAEVARSKAQLRAGLAMSLESSSARSEQLARGVLIHGRVLTSQEIVEKVDRVTPDAIRTYAERLVAGTPSVAVVGAGRKSRGFAEKAGRLAAVAA